MSKLRERRKVKTLTSEYSMLPPELEAEIDDCCDRYEAAWLAGSAPNLEEFLNAATEAARPHLLKELVALERHYRRDSQGQPICVDRLASIYPQLADELPTAEMLAPARIADNNETSESDVVPVTEMHPRQSQASRGLHVRCPHCSNGMEILADSPFEDVTCATCGSTFNLVEREGPTTAARTLRRLGRFDLISRLGVGGFGTVWKARDTELDRLVAIKIPRKGQLSPADVEQFYREARAAAQLHHPNIVAVYEVGRAEDSLFIVSDFVRGVPLSDYLSTQQLSPREIAEMGTAIAEALAHAHDQGIIHRDLKPSNIMIDDEGRPLIMDFGLAKRDVGEITMTVDGQILGTPGYMSPEQARGQSHWTDRRSDVYSLGTVLFRMATGELPFRGNVRMQLQQKLADDPPDPRRLVPTIPRDFATICLKCIQRDPNQRYPNASEVALELQRFLKGEPIKARPLSRPARLWRWACRKPALASAALLGCLLAIAGPMVAWQQHLLVQQEKEKVREEQTRNAEREKLIARQKIEADAKAATIQELQDELTALKGGSSGIADKLPSWRVKLINDLVTAREQEMAAILEGEPPENLTAIQAGLGLGILQAQLGYHEKALKTLLGTERRIATLTRSGADDTALLDAQADCWQRIAHLQQLLGHPSEAQSFLKQAIQLRRRLSEREQGDVGQKVRLLESTVQMTSSEKTTTAEHLATMHDAPSMIDRISQNWPTSAEEFYRLACQLTKSDVLLESKQKPPSGP